MFIRVLAALGVCAIASRAVADVPGDLARATALLKANSLNEAKSIFEQMLPSVRSSSDSRSLGLVLRGLSDIDLAQGKLPLAIEHARECATLFAKQRNTTEEVYCRTVIGRAQVLAGDYGQALSAYKEALSIARVNENSEARVTLLNNIGNVYYFQGRSSAADQSYRAAMRQLETSRQELWYDRRLRLTQANRATLLQRIGQYQRALDVYGQLRSSPGKLPQAEEAQLLVNIGALYRRLGDSVKALELYRTAEAIFRSNGNTDGVARSIIN